MFDNLLFLAVVVVLVVTALAIANAFSLALFRSRRFVAWLNWWCGTADHDAFVAEMRRVHRTSPRSLP